MPQLLLFRTLAVPSCEECLIPALPEEVLISIVYFAAPLTLFYQSGYPPFGSNLPSYQRSTMVVLTGTLKETYEFFEDLFLCTCHPFSEAALFHGIVEEAAQSRGLICRRYILGVHLIVKAFAAIPGLRPRVVY